MIISIEQQYVCENPTCCNITHRKVTVDSDKSFELPGTIYCAACFEEYDRRPFEMLKDRRPIVDRSIEEETNKDDNLED